MARFTLLQSLLLFVTFVTAHRLAHPHADPKRQVTNSGTSSNTSSCYYWLENIKHQGLAPLAGAGYQVFRNVKDYGVKGDGVTDDTDAINRVISEGGRCAPGVCGSTTITPAVVYFPPGTYKISRPIIQYYYTQLIGNPNCLPVIKATSDFKGIALIDSDPYGANGLGYIATNVFWRQIRNFKIDQTDIPISEGIFGVHWPTGQATSLQNLVFNMSSAAGTQHSGLFIESGSGGFMSDLVFYGGLNGALIGNQQFTMRNFTFYNAVNAVNQLYSWGWTYTGFSINNCSVGFNLTSGGPTAQSVGSVTIFDSQIKDTPVGILTAFTNPTSRFTNGSVILERIKLDNVPVAVRGPTRDYLPGTTGKATIAAWGQGHAYIPLGPLPIQGPIPPNNRPAGLLSEDGSFYQRSKPQYEKYPAAQFISARDQGATGNGVTDDTAALQKAINAAIAQKRFLFIDAGSYKVSSTIYIPAGSVIVGETYPVILGSGSFFSDVNAPKPVVQIGKPGEKGSIEWSDAIVSTQGATAGAILFEYNLASSGPGKTPIDKRQDWGNWHGSDGTKTTKVCKPKSTTTVSLPQAHTSSSIWEPWTTSTTKSTGTGSSSTTASYTQTTTAGGNSTGTGSFTSTTVSSTTTLSATGSFTGSFSSTTTPSTTGSFTGSFTSTTTSSLTGSFTGSFTTTTVSITGSFTSTTKSSTTTTTTTTSTSPPIQTYTPTGPAGMWDVHARVGGFAGSELTLAECPTTATVFSPVPQPINERCIAAFLTFHVTSSAANAYFENVWIWVADHDIEDPQLRQITIYAGRGLLVESTKPIWLWGGAVEHHTLYQYQFNRASTVYMGQIQTETAYYQPNPPVLFPFSPNAQYSDPSFSSKCFANTGFNFTNSPNFRNSCDGWGLRIVNSNDLLIYGAGLYSFFDNYNTSCSAVPSNPSGPYGCQTQIFSLEGNLRNINVYNLNTVGAQSMITLEGLDIADYRNNQNVFPNSLALFRV